MRRAYLDGLLALAVVGLSVQPSPAAPIDDAKAASAQGQYQKVDSILAADLQQKTPPIESLRVSMEAALASGKVVTAGSRATAMHKQGSIKDPLLLLETARIADLNGDAHNALLRYLDFCRQTNARSDEADEAFCYILRREAYPDQYKKYVQLFGADSRSWALGALQLNRLIDALDADRALDLAGFLIASFPDPKNVGAIHSTLDSAASAYVFGKESKDRYLKPLLVMGRGEPENLASLDRVYQQAQPAMDPQRRIEFTLDLMSRYTHPLTPGILNQLGTDLRAIKSDDVRLAAGRKYLDKRTVYAQATDKDSIYWYLRQIGESPTVFNIKDRVLVDAAAITEMMDSLSAKMPEQTGRLQEFLQWASVNYLSATPDARRAFLEKNLPHLNRDQLGDLETLSKANWNQTLAHWAEGKPYPVVLEARVQQIHFFNDQKDKAGLLATARDYLAANPGNFSPDQVRNNVINSTLPDAGEKLALLGEAIERGGYSNPMRDLLNSIAADAAWSKNPQFIQLKANFETKPAGNDAVAHLLILLQSTPVNRANPDAALLAECRKFAAGYQDAVPPGEEDVHTLAQLQIQEIISGYASHVWENAPAVIGLADDWLPRTPIGGSTWRTITGRLREMGAVAEIDKLVPLFGKLVRANKSKNDALVWNNFAGIGAAPGSTTNRFADVYDVMPTDIAAAWLWNQRDVWSSRHQYIADELAKVVAVPGARFTDVGLVNQLIAHINSWMGERDFKVPWPLIHSLWNSYVANADQSNHPDADVEGNALSTMARGGPDRSAEYAAAFEIWSESVAKRPLDAQLLAYAEMFRWNGNIPTEPAGTPATPGFRHHMIFKVLKPLYERVAPRQREQVIVSSAVLSEISSTANAPPPADPKADPRSDPKTYGQRLTAYQEEHAEAISYAKTIIDMLCDGARTDAPANYTYGVADLLVRETLPSGDRLKLAQALQRYSMFLAQETNWDGAWNQVLPPLMKTLEERKDDEAIYAFLNSLQAKAKIPDAISRQMLLAKAKAGTQIPGIIPVSPDDPSYDLFLAAHDLAIGDEQHAWELTSPKLKLLVQTWPALDPGYVAWSVEQLRKQKMLKDGLEFSFNILLHEAELDADIAARVLLAKGDLYRDMENYQAARIEYEGLKNNNRYNKTDAGGKAVYRLVDLYILTRDYSAAETLLEHLVDADTVQRQADAYYLYAKMAFQKGDYKEARDDLKKVKDRVLNHVEAALLEGELNLVLPGGLQNTEVAIGDPRLSTVVIPGRPLSLTLQDPNLSIARGGAAIPVVITTSKGGDVEHVKLLPSSSNKNLFTARIATALGAPQKDNLTLELKGDDTVSYEIEPAFQKANDLHYPPKTLEVRFDARLVASSGEILSEEEEEKRELERQLQMREAGTSRRFEMSRDGRTVRPGSQIFLQVTDFCQDLTDAPDKVSVDLKTGLGDSLEGVELTETGPHTGIFRGSVPTVVPLPRASASDSDAGHAAAGVIQADATDSWTSLSDGKKGKWIEVDTMGSHEITSLSAVIPHLEQIKDVSVQGMLADDYEELATFPSRAENARGGLLLDNASDQNGETIEQIHRHLKLATTSTLWQENPSFDRDATPMKGREGWQTNRLKGNFYLPENKALEFKWLSPPPPQDWLRCHLLIDGQEVLDGHNATTFARIGRIELPKGTHTYELLVRDNFAHSSLVVGYKTSAGNFAPVPADWFSTTAHAELLERLKPKGTIAISGDTLSLKLNEPRRLRKLRLVFNDFLGTSVSVKKIVVADSSGAPVTPVAKQELAGKRGSSLQISPGDSITVSYNDRRRLREDSKVLTSNLNSSYFNGRIVLAEEVIKNVGDQRRTEYLEAKRCRRGDQLVVIVTDYDEDTSEQRDTVPVTVKTSSGEQLVLQALETWTNGGEDQHNHAGEFIAVLKIGDKTGKDTIKVQSGDKITVSYLDKENTDPGVAVERSYSVNEAGAGRPDVLIYRTRVKMVQDDSPEAHARLKRLAGKEVKGAVLYKPLTIARHPDYVSGAEPATPSAAGGQAIAAVNAPLLFEVNYPEHVLNAGSVLQITAVAESELKAAAAEKREPKSVTVPTYVEGIERLAQIKGYPIQLESPFHKDAKAMLRDGAFAGVIRLQIGSPGDPIDDMVVGGEREFSRETTAASDDQAYWYKVPTLLVSGSDIVHLRIKDDGGAVSESVVRLLSDGVLELMDPSYTIQSDSIHLGEKFHIKLTEPDHDVSNERDTVKIRARSGSGGDVTVTLNETLPHSGIFTAAIQPEYIGEAKGGSRPTTQPGGKALYVNFGDDIVFDYVDDLSLQSISPVTVTKKGKILFGADAQIAVFTKRFKDPEIAVKTRFLMAESLFETAKEHRKLNDIPRADEEIARGKMILEEAIRDYPNTSLAAQGDYLLANLAQELNRFQEAIGRYSNVISTWPDSEYASQAQFKKALCFEKLENYDQAVEEYVKLTYIYPESALVPDATVRLGNYYYKKQSFKVASRIFYNFQQKNPSHKLAAEALFLSAQCEYKLADYKESGRLFQKVVDEYPDDKVVRPEAMYWLADSEVKANDNVKAFQTFKKVTWDYPESEWAKRARGRLTEDLFSHMQDEQ